MSSKANQPNSTSQSQGTKAEAKNSSVTFAQVKDWLKQWSSSDQTTRDQAEQQLVAAGDVAIGYLVRILRDESSTQRSAAATYLIDHIGARNTDAIAALGQCLTATDSALRHAAFQALEPLPTATLAKLAPKFLALAADTKENEAYRVRAIRTLGRIGSAAGSVAAPLEKLVHSDANPRVRRAALAAIEKIAAPEQAEQIYLQILRSHAPVELRRNVPLLLSRVAITDKAIDGLIAAFGDSDAELRKQASLALVAIGRPTVKALLAALQQPSVATRRYAIYTLGKLGPLAKDAIPALEKLQHDPNPEVAQLAKAALKLIRRR